MDTLLTDVSFVPLVFSRNRLVHTIDAAAPEMASRLNLKYALEIQVPTFPQSQIYEALHRSYGRETPAVTVGGISSFAGAKFEYNRRNGKLDGFLTYQKPNWKQNKMTTILSQTTPFKLREIVQGGTPAVNTDTTLATKWCIKAGLSDEDFIVWQNDFWSTYQANKRQFLTWQPSKKTIGRVQEEYLYFLVNFAPLPSKIRLRVQTYTSSGSSLETKAELANVALGTIVLCPVGVEALELADDIIKYDVWLSDEQNRRLSEVRTYVIDQQYRPNERHILFSNSLGGFDTLRLIGKGSETLKVSQTFAQRDSNQQAVDWLEMVVINTEGRKELTVSTGWSQSPDFLKYLDELMLSEQIFLITSKGHIPLRRSTNSLVDAEDNTDLIARTFSFAFDKIVQNYSDAKTDVAITSTARATLWEPLQWVHILDNYGKRTGRMRPVYLRKVYADDRTPYKPSTIKLNIDSDPDYIPDLVNPTIVQGSTPYPNTAIVRQGTYVRTNCEANKVGGFATITIAANKYGGEALGEAQRLAELEYASLNTQAYANLYGECLINPYDYVLSVPSDYAHFRQMGIDTTYDSIVNGNSGNAWYLDSEDPNANVYLAGTWDILISTVYNSSDWILFISGSNWTCRVYVNGVLLREVICINDNTGALNTIIIPFADIPGGSRVFIHKIKM